MGEGDRLRIRVVEDIEEIASFDVHDFRVLSISVLRKSNETWDTARSELGLHELAPRYRNHMEYVVYLEASCYSYFHNDVSTVRVTRDHPFIDRMREHLQWEQEVGIEPEPQPPWDVNRYVCFQAASSLPNSEPLDSEDDGILTCPKSFPAQLTVIGKRIWAEEISGHSRWP